MDSTPEENKARWLQKAKEAEEAFKLDDWRMALKFAVETGVPLDETELRNVGELYGMLFYFQTLMCQELEAEAKEYLSGRGIDVKEMQERVIRKHRDLCYEALGLLNTILIPRAADTKSKLYYMMRKVDIVMILGMAHPAYTTVLQDCAAGFNDAVEFAKKETVPTDSSRLDVDLNYAKFCYQHLEDKDRGKEIAKQALDEANEHLAKSEEQPSEETKWAMTGIETQLKDWEDEEKGGDGGGGCDDGPPAKKGKKD